MPNKDLKEELKDEDGVNIGSKDINYDYEDITDGNLQENIYTIFKRFIKISSKELEKHGKKITNLDTLEKEIDAMYRVRSDVVKKLNNNQEVRDNMNMNKNKRGLVEIFDTIQEKCKRPKKSGGKKKRKTKKLKKKAKTKKSKMKKIKRKTMKKKKSKKHKR